MEGQRGGPCFRLLPNGEKSHIIVEQHQKTGGWGRRDGGNSMALDQKYFEEMEAKIPRGKVRTRFAPSPTGYMHVGNLRTALYTWLIARNAGGTFILRIEDTDQGRLVEGATDVIYRTLAECGLSHDEGPDVGGPVSPYVQSQRRDTYGRYARLLVEKGCAYYCFCEKTESEEDSGDFTRSEDPCRSLPLEQALARAGMTMDDINTVEMTVDGMTTAMISGQIDAAASWSPNTVTLQNALGDNYVDLGTNADFLDSAIFPSSYICTPEYAEANHDILVRFAQALDKAHDWRAAHPEEMAKLLAKELDAPEDTMLAAVGEADWLTITEVCGHIDAIKTVYETQQGIFLDNGTITENVPVEDYVLFDVMQEAYDAYRAAK